VKLSISSLSELLFDSTTIVISSSPFPLRVLVKLTVLFVSLFSSTTSLPFANTLKISSFSQLFAVWQDLNSDAKTDEGELLTLSELGIESIELSYRDESEARVDGDGDVKVLGQANINYEDGSTGLAEDTTFAQTTVEENSGEILSIGQNQSDESENESIGQAPPYADELSSAFNTAELVDQFLESNPVDDGLRSDIEQELIQIDSIQNQLLDDYQESSDEYSQIEFDETHENDLELNMELELVEAMNTESLDVAAISAVEDESSAAF